jgi:hypothetical protein
VGHIFINYRSTDVPYGASFLDNALVHHFGAGQVFRDSRSIDPGDLFDPKIMKAVREAAAVLAVIGPNWPGQRNENGQRQIDDPSDFIHRELAEAHEHGVRIVPVLMETPRLKAGDLPKALTFLVERQDRTVRMRESETDVQALIAALAETLPELEPKQPVKSRAGNTIKADKIGAIFNEKVRVNGDLNIM